MALNLSITVCAVPDCKLDTLQILKNYLLRMDEYRRYFSI